MFLEFLDKPVNPEIAEALERFLEEYDVLRSRPASEDRMKTLRRLICETYLSSCRTLDDMVSVHRAIMRNEEHYPMPATIRRYIRMLNMVEADVDPEAGI